MVYDHQYLAIFCNFIMPFSAFVLAVEISIRKIVCLIEITNEIEIIYFCCRSYTILIENVSVFTNEGGVFRSCVPFL